MENIFIKLGLLVIELLLLLLIIFSEERLTNPDLRTFKSKKYHYSLMVMIGVGIIDFYLYYSYKQPYEDIFYDLVVGLIVFLFLLSVFEHRDYKQNKKSRKWTIKFAVLTTIFMSLLFLISTMSRLFARFQ